MQPQAGESYLDLTAGYGGHAELVLQMTQSPELSTLVDRDGKAVEALASKFPNVEIMNTDFYSACQSLNTAGRSYDIILADLGVSSPHLNNPERGFAFSTDGPLDMRMDQTAELSAHDLVNHATEAELADIFKKYGEEPKAKQIARAIVNSRPINGTQELAQIVAKAYGVSYRRRKVHPATLTFQALRIAVNDELSQIERTLPLMQSLLAPGGRLAIISFHSLEDRLVKQYFIDQAGDRYDAELRSLTKKPIMAGQDEIVFNPRARSAKLRAVVKIKNRKD